jgi:hypothetical protein
MPMTVIKSDRHLEIRAKCDCCGFENPIGGLTLTMVMHDNRKSYDVCEICRSTYIFNAFCLPEAHGGVPTLFQSLGFIGNMLRRELAP